MTPEQIAAIEEFFADIEEMRAGTGRHEGHQVKQVGRCVYCSCGQHFQGQL